MDLNQAFEEVVGSNQTLAVVLLILANFALGVLAALKDGRFTWEELSDILASSKKLTPLIGYLVASTVGQGITGPAGDVVQNGALLAALPYVLSTWKSLKATGAPQVVTKTIAHTIHEVIDTKPPDPLAATKSLAVELRDLMAAYASGSLTVEDVKKRVAALQITYPGYPGLPVGWPGGSS